MLTAEKFAELVSPEAVCRLGSIEMYGNKKHD
jgi:hypothetical protein